MPLHPLDSLREKVRDLHARRDTATPGRTRGAAPAKREPGPLSRLANAWWTRLIESVYDGGLSAQEAEYESGETRRDYL